MNGCDPCVKAEVFLRVDSVDVNAFVIVHQVNVDAFLAVSLAEDGGVVSADVFQFHKVGHHPGLSDSLQTSQIHITVARSKGKVDVIFRIESAGQLFSMAEVDFEDLLDLQIIKRHSFDDSVAEPNQSLGLVVLACVFVADDEHHTALILVVRLESHHLVAVLVCEQLQLVRSASAAGRKDVSVRRIEFAVLDGVLVSVVARNKLNEYLLSKVDVENRSCLSSDEAFIVEIIHSHRDNR